MYDRTTHNIANKGFSGLRSSVFRFNFCNGGQERSPQSLTSHTAGTLHCMAPQIFSNPNDAQSRYAVFVSPLNTRISNRRVITI